MHEEIDDAQVEVARQFVDHRMQIEVAGIEQVTEPFEQTLSIRQRPRPAMPAVARLDPYGLAVATDATLRDPQASKRQSLTKRWHL